MLIEKRHWTRNGIFLYCDRRTRSANTTVNYFGCLNRFRVNIGNLMSIFFLRLWFYVKIHLIPPLGHQIRLILARTSKLSIHFQFVVCFFFLRCHFIPPLCLFLSLDIHIPLSCVHIFLLLVSVCERRKSVEVCKLFVCVRSSSLVNAFEMYARWKQSPDIKCTVE